MNLLLLGGAGFIGSALCHQLVCDNSFNLYVYEPEGTNISRIEDIKSKLHIIRGTISDVDNIKTILQQKHIDVVMHLVSTLIPGSSYEDYQREFECVILPSIKLIRYCTEVNVKFVFFSSGGTVYGNCTKGSFRETDMTLPISYYGVSKLILEDCVLMEHRLSGLDYLILRPSNPYGKGQNIFGQQGLIAVAIGKVMKDEPIEIWGDGSSLRDYIYIDDLADSVYKLLKKNINNEILNIGSGRGYSINDVLMHIKNATGKDVKILYKESRRVDVNNMVLEIAKLKELIDVKHTKIAQGIKSFYDYVCKTN